MAQGYVSVFQAWLGRGQICEAAARAVLRSHRARSRKVGSDVTFGAADVMAQALGLTSVDLEDGEELAYAAPLWASRHESSPSRAAGAGAGAAAAAAEVVEEEEEDPGAAAVEAAYLHQALKATAMWRYTSGPGLPASSSVYVVGTKGPHVIILSASTEVGPASMHYEAADVVGALESRRALAMLLFAG
jgi:hypothetical protein